MKGGVRPMRQTPRYVIDGPAVGATVPGRLSGYFWRYSGQDSFYDYSAVMIALPAGERWAAMCVLVREPDEVSEAFWRCADEEGCGAFFAAVNHPEQNRVRT